MRGYHCHPHCFCFCFVVLCSVTVFCSALRCNVTRAGVKRYHSCRTTAPCCATVCVPLHYPPPTHTHTHTHTHTDTHQKRPPQDAASYRPAPPRHNDGPRGGNRGYAEKGAGEQDGGKVSAPIHARLAARARKALWPLRVVRPLLEHDRPQETALDRSNILFPRGGPASCDHGQCL